MNRLKPCPFCGYNGVSILVDEYGNPNYPFFLSAKCAEQALDVGKPKKKQSENGTGEMNMATVKCVIGKRGRPSHEWNDGQKDHIYCLGLIDQMTDAPLPECVACRDFVDKAQDDLEAFYRRAENG